MKSALFGVAVLLLGTSALAQNVSDHNFRLVPEIVPESKPTVETKELTEDPHDCPRATAMKNRMACSEGPQLGEPTRTSIIEYGVKHCVGSFGDVARKSYTSKEIEEWCGCAVTLQANYTTQDEYESMRKTGNYSKEWYVMKEEVRAYCQEKYMKTPDVTAIKDRRW
jgi:hypothetical protein